MIKKIFLVALFLSAVCASVSAKNVGEYLQTMPESVCPLLKSAELRDSTEYLHVTLSSVSEFEMRVLSCDDGTKRLCVVQTFKAPLAESDVRIYDEEWNECAHLVFGLSDVIGEENAEKYRKLFEPLLIEAHLNGDDESLALRLSYTNLSEEEKKEIKDVELQTSLKWNGKTFK